MGCFSKRRYRLSGQSQGRSSSAYACLILRERVYALRNSVPEFSQSYGHRLREWMAEQPALETSTLAPSVSTRPHRNMPSVSTTVSASPTSRRPSPATLVEVSKTSPVKRPSRQRKMASVDVEEILRRRGTRKTNTRQTLQIKNERSKPVLSSEISQAFQKSMERAIDEMRAVSVEAEVWIGLATWWLLKVSFTI